MPQLDQFTYLTQFVWLCVFYMTFYVLLYNDGLPKMSRILKLRTQLVSQQSAGADYNHQEIEQDVIIKACLNSSVSYLSSSVSGASKWCNEMVANLNANQLQPINKSYVSSLAEISMSEAIKHNVLDHCAPLRNRRGTLRLTQPLSNTIKDLPSLLPASSSLQQQNSSSLQIDLKLTALKLNQIYVLRAQRSSLIKNGPRKKTN